MDYAFSHAVRYWDGDILTVILFYDVACQYHKWFWERIAKAGEVLTLPDGTKVRWVIGAFHVHGHNKECYARYASIFVPGTGQVDGEIIETLWVPLDLVSGHLQGMGSGHRQESIDMHMSDSNWKKLIRMCMSSSVFCLF